MADVLLLSSGRVAAAEPTLSDGATTSLLLDTKGRLLVSQKPAIFSLQSSGLVNVNDAIAFNVEDSASLALHVKNYGTVTMAAGTFAFEASLDSTTGTDGTWFSIQAARSNGNTIETTAALSGIAAAAGNTYGWRIGTVGFKWVRVRCTVAVTASAIAFWQGIEAPSAVDPVPAIGTHGVTGSVTTTPATATNYQFVTSATTNANVIKSAAGTLFEVTIFNPTAALIYVKFYNKATAPTVGTDIPMLVVPVPINANVPIEFGAIGKRFGSGISWAATAGPLTNDVAAIAAGAIVNADYI